jgi:hypothetical protein
MVREFRLSARRTRDDVLMFKRQRREDEKRDEARYGLVFSRRCFVALRIRFAECVVFRFGTAAWRIGEGRKGSEGRRSRHVGASIWPTTEAMAFATVSANVVCRDARSRVKPVRLNERAAMAVGVWRGRDECQRSS